VHCKVCGEEASWGALCATCTQSAYRPLQNNSRGCTRSCHKHKVRHGCRRPLCSPHTSSHCPSDTVSPRPRALFQRSTPNNSAMRGVALIPVPVNTTTLLLFSLCVRMCVCVCGMCVCAYVCVRARARVWEGVLCRLKAFRPSWGGGGAYKSRYRTQSQC
jgi:hypothetical protein